MSTTRSDVRGTPSEASLASRSRSFGDWTTICRVSTVRAKARAHRGRRSNPAYRAALLRSETAVKSVDLSDLHTVGGEVPRRGRRGRRVWR